jgi:hypothetical protein
MFNLGSKWASLKIPLFVFPFGGICVYYIMVYKQKKSTWTGAGGASWLPHFFQREYRFPTKIRFVGKSRVT